MNNEIMHPKKIKKGLAYVILTMFTAIIFLFSATSCYFLPQEEEALAPPLQKPDAVEFSTIEVTRDTIIREIGGMGYIRSTDMQELYFVVGGRISKIYTDMKDLVTEGQLLAELDPGTIAQDIENQEIEIERKKLSIDNIQKSINSNIESIQSELVIMKMDLEQAQKKLAKSKTDYEKKKEVLAVNDQESLLADIESQEFNIEKSKINIQNKEKSLEKAKQGDDYSLKNANLDLENAELKLKQLLEKYEQTKIYSPIDGIITFRQSNTHEGDYINPYARLFTVADPTKTIIEHNNTAAATDFATGMKLKITYNREEYDGIVVSTPNDMPQGELEGRDQYKTLVRIKVEDLPVEAEMGAAVNVKLELSRRENVIVIPKSAVNTIGTRNYVNVQEEGLRVERDVELGVQTNTQVEITSGLKEGELLILR